MRQPFALSRDILFPLGFLLIVSFSAYGNARAPVFPVKVCDNGRYLVDQNNTPFFIQADTPWSLFVALAKTEAETYLENRSQKGFNTITVNLIEHWYKGDSTAYPFGSINGAGDAPFSGYLANDIPDFSRPNDVYFDHVDYVIGKALEKGIMVMMTPAYMGYIGTQEGWYTEVLANGATRCRDYGRYLGNRYKKFPNIIWIMDGDRNPDSLSRPLIREIIAGIKEKDSTHLFTAHCHPTNSSRDQWEGESWLDLNAVYTYNRNGKGTYIHEKCLVNYQKIPVKPVFLFETTYEGEHNFTSDQIRTEMYWGWLCGIGGQQMGNNPIWKFANGWQAAMDGQGSTDAARLKKLVDSRDWHKLEPDFNHKVVTSGYGSEERYISAAITTDGETIVVYIPPDGEPFHVDMSKVSGKKASIWWYNPRNGDAVSAGKYATKNIRLFRKPDNRDWVMVIDDASANFQAPGK